MGEEFRCLGGGEKEFLCFLSFYVVLVASHNKLLSSKRGLN